MATDELFTREEALQGLPGRRARTLLFQIEVAAARAAENRRRVPAWIGAGRSRPAPPPPDDEAATEGWLGALGRGRDALPRPSIRQIQRYAKIWAYLAPPDPRLQAALAHALGRKYRFTRAAVPGIRAALALDGEPVRRAYEEMYGQPIDGIYAPRVGPVERLRWSYAALGEWLDGLPPFWLTFAYLLMGNFPSTVLILPIVVATLGPSIGLALLCLLGGANLLTIVCLAEASVRSGDIEYRNVFLGRMTAGYLGGAGFDLAYYNFIAQCFLAVLAGQVGIALTLAHTVGLPPAIWALAWGLFLIYRLWRVGQSGKITSDMLLGSACVAAAVILSLIALAHARPGFLGPASGVPLDLSVLGAFGGILMCYYGHSAIPFCAKMALPRDPGGRELIRGCIAGTLGAIALQALFLIALSAALPPEALRGASETALGPLGDHLGPSVAAAGLVTACLFIGLDGTGSSDVLFGLIQERIPAFSHSMVALSRRQGRLLFSRRGDRGDSPRLGLAYLGPTGGLPRFRVDLQSGLGVKRQEIAFDEHWEIEALFEPFPELRRQGYRLSLELVEADAEAARLLIATSLAVEQEGGRDAGGLSVVESLDLSPEALGLLRWLMVRGEAGVAEAAADGQGEESEIGALFAALEERRMVQRVERPGGGEPRYRPRWTKRRRSRLPEGIWRSLETAGPEAPGASQAPAAPAAPARGKQRISAARERARAVRERAREAEMSDAGRFVLGASPLAAATIVALWLLLRGTASFAAILEVGGILTNILAAGIFPVLLLASCRRKGMSVPRGRWQWLTHPALLAGLYLFFLGVLVLHGVIRWHGVPGRVSALMVAALTLAATIHMVRRGSFARGVVVELREDLRPGAQPLFRVMAGGQPAPAAVHLAYAEGERHLEAASGEIPEFPTLQSAEFGLPPTGARELRVWVHRVTREGDSEAVPALVEVHSGQEVHRSDLGLLGGEARLPFPGDACRVRITLSPPSG
jgi:hypothetical protein